MRDPSASPESPDIADKVVEGLSAMLYVATGTAMLAAARHGYLTVEGVFNSAENVNALSLLFKTGALGGLAYIGFRGLEYLGVYQEEIRNGFPPTLPDQE